jgi:hypothetical protein
VNYSRQLLGVIEHALRHAVADSRLPVHFPISDVLDDLQARSDLETLDHWQRNFGWRVGMQQWLPTGAWRCTLTAGDVPPYEFEGSTPDEARAKAAAWVREQARPQREEPCPGCGHYGATTPIARRSASASSVGAEGSAALSLSQPPETCSRSRRRPASGSRPWIRSAVPHRTQIALEGL